MKQSSPGRLVELSDDARDPLVRAMRSALTEDPSSGRLAQLGARVDTAIAAGTGPRLADTARGTGNAAAYLAGVAVAVVAALFLTVALLDDPPPSAPPIAQPRASTPASMPVEASRPAPRVRGSVEQEPLGLPPAPPPRSRDRKARAVESSTSRALGPDDELELLRRAQDALPRDGRAALLLVQEHERAYPHGLLEQERELLAIAALLSLEQLEPARRRAQGFRAAFPRSVHLRRLDRMLAADGRGTAATGNGDAEGTLTPQ